MQTEKTFGAYVREKRLKLEPYLSLREVARQLDISHVYLSGIEIGKMPAPTDDILAKLVKILKLNIREQEYMLDLAAKSKVHEEVPKDIRDYIAGNQYAREFLRYAKNLDLSDNEWKDFISQLKRRSYEQETKR